MIEKVELSLGKNNIIIETGKMARQADGAVTVQIGESVVFSAACSGKGEVPETQDFFPLFVDYRERTYAAGKIPGGFFKREAKPSSRETLCSRLIDRTLRPLFPKDYLNDVQVSALVLSADGINNPDIAGMIAASASLAISEIPFQEPIGAVRVGLVDGEFIANPTFEELENSLLDLVVAGTKDNINMIEAGANEVTEEQMVQALEFGHDQIKLIVEAQEELVKKCGKKKIEVTPRPIDENVWKTVSEVTAGKFAEIHLLPEKMQRREALNSLYDEVIAKFDTEADDFNVFQVKRAFHDIEQNDVRSLIVNQKKRPDGRGFTDIRHVECEVGVLPRTHGSGLFTRGETQALALATLGTKADQQRIDALEGESKKTFMLHYNFPGFSVGECKPNRGPGRREIGHGALAERALEPMIPSAEEFPYTIRLVSEIMESNGSSSQASICGGSLALMDAGVPLKKPVAGIAMGLVTDGDDYEVLTDIAGMEDHLGDMDFKVAGTEDGITALQLDLKIKGITFDIISKAFQQAKDARMFLLEKMKAAIEAPRDDLSEFAPRIQVLSINPDKIKDLIGPGGKVIKKIIEETGATIDITDDGTVHIASSDSEAARKAIEQIEIITKEIEVNSVYAATVKRVTNFGAFCEIAPGKEGLVHVSEISNEYVKKVEDIVNVGDKVRVKVIAIDNLGRINLSIKALAENNTENKQEAEEAPEE